jgi:hypothetical protein
LPLLKLIRYESQDNSYLILGVSFDLEVALVVNWRTCVRHCVPVSSTFVGFCSQVLQKFEDEISSKNCSLFLVQGNEPVIEKTRITAENYEKSLRRYLTSNDDNLSIFFHNEVASPQGSPTKSSPPKKPAGGASQSDNASTSKASSNSQTSLQCKLRDSFTCKLCGYVGNSSNVKAAHLFERIEYFALNETERSTMLISLDLGDIEEARNKLTLCVGCHKYFDAHKVGIQPLEDLKVGGRWVVKNELHHEKTTQGRPFGAFVNKEVNFSSYVSVSLVKHRYQRFLKATKRSVVPSSIKESKLAHRLQRIAISPQDSGKDDGEFILVTPKRKNKAKQC